MGRLNDPEELDKRFENIREILFPHLASSSAKQARAVAQRFNKRHNVSKDPFPVGSYVMAIDPKRTNKQEPFYFGPLKVLRRTRGGSYVLLDSDGALLSHNVPPSHLKLISFDPPSNEQAYEVESILSHRGPPAQREYLVKWKHYPASENSWVAADSFNDTACISTYWARRSQSK